MATFTSDDHAAEAWYAKGLQEGRRQAAHEAGVAAGRAAAPPRAAAAPTAAPARASKPVQAPQRQSQAEIDASWADTAARLNAKLYPNAKARKAPGTAR